MSYARWRPEFARAMDSRLYSIDFLDALIEAGEAHFWPGSETAIVTRFHHFPTGARAIEGLVAAGDLGEIAESLIPAAEAWGRRQGCAFAMIASREGWARALKGDGYQPFQLTLIKNLSG